MRSMLDLDCRRELLRRLRSLTPETPRRWGTMTAPHMVAHLTDQMRHTLGEREVAPRLGPLRWPPLRWAAIYWLPWPRGRLQGPPEAFTTKPGSWDDDLAALESLVERFAAREVDGEWSDHFLFGRMSGRDWGAFCFRHFDHHLRQFGA